MIYLTSLPQKQLSNTVFHNFPVIYIHCGIRFHWDKMFYASKVNGWREVWGEEEV